MGQFETNSGLFWNWICFEPWSTQWIDAHVIKQELIDKESRVLLVGIHDPIDLAINCDFAHPPSDFGFN